MFMRLIVCLPEPAGCFISSSARRSFTHLSQIPHVSPPPAPPAPPGLLCCFLFLFSCSVSKWQLWEAAGATLTRSDAITGSRSTCVDVAQWHTRMTYYHREPNAGSAVTDTLTWIRRGSKVSAPSVTQPRIYYNRLHMTASLRGTSIRLQAPGGMAPDSGMIQRKLLTFLLITNICWLSSSQKPDDKSSKKRSICNQTD